MCLQVFLTFLMIKTICWHGYTFTKHLPNLSTTCCCHYWHHCHWPVFQRSLQVRSGPLMVSGRKTFGADCCWEAFYIPDAFSVTQSTVKAMKGHLPNVNLPLRWSLPLFHNSASNTPWLVSLCAFASQVLFQSFSLPLRFTGRFCRWISVSRYQNVSILDFVGAKGGGGGGDNWSCKTCKVPVMLLPPTNQHPVILKN